MIYVEAGLIIKDSLEYSILRFLSPGSLRKCVEFQLFLRQWHFHKHAQAYHSCTEYVMFLHQTRKARKENSCQHYPYRHTFTSISFPYVYNVINLLKLSGFFTYHLVLHSKILHGARFALSVLCGSQNKQRLLLYTSLSDWFS